MARYRMNPETGEMAEIFTERKYLVNGVTEDSEWSEIMSAEQIFSMMDMSDCIDISIDIWRINGYGEALVECQFLGPWVAGGAKDPLRMEIRSADRGVEAVGYGTDH